MRSVNLREIAHYIAAALAALAGFFGVPLACYALFPQMSLLVEYLANAVMLIMMFAVPALLIVSARPQRLQRFKGLIKRPTSETAGLCMLCAVSATVMVSLIVSVWLPYAEMLAGRKLENPPLPVPENAWEWALSLLCIAVVPAICEELFFRGFVQPALAQRFPRAALWITAVCFAALHFEPAAFPGLLLVGWLLGMLLEKRGLLAGMLFHAVYNAVVLILSTVSSGIGLFGVFLSVMAYIFTVRRLKKEENIHAVNGSGV